MMNTRLVLLVSFVLAHCALAAWHTSNAQADEGDATLQDRVDEMVLHDATVIDFIGALNLQLSGASSAVILPAFEDVPSGRRSFTIGPGTLEEVLARHLDWWDCGWYLSGGRVLICSRLTAVRRRELGRLRAAQSRIAQWLDGAPRTLQVKPRDFPELLDALAFYRECGSVSYLVSPSLWGKLRFDSLTLVGRPRAILMSVAGGESCTATAANDLLFLAGDEEIQETRDLDNLLVPPYSRSTSPENGARVRIVDWIAALREAAWLIPIDDTAVDPAQEFPVDMPLRLQDASTATTLFVLGKITHLNPLVVRSASSPTFRVEFRKP